MTVSLAGPARIRIRAGAMEENGATVASMQPATRRSVATVQNPIRVFAGEGFGLDTGRLKASLSAFLEWSIHQMVNSNSPFVRKRLHLSYH